MKRIHWGRHLRECRRLGVRELPDTHADSGQDRHPYAGGNNLHACHIVSLVCLMGYATALALPTVITVQSAF